MTTLALDAVSTACQQRLTDHYGDDAGNWLDTVPRLLTDAAKRWGLRVDGYHDVGHASVVATARDQDGRHVVVKAWFDRTRFAHEVDALRLWADGPVARLLDADPNGATALLEMVGGRPGGAQAPRCETQSTALAIHGLHLRAHGSSLTNWLPRLDAHLHDEVLPRIRERQAAVGQGPHHDLVRTAARRLPHLEPNPERATVLHGDLYRENVLFDEHGSPRLIDPLPMAGDAAYDWGFWIVYHDLGAKTDLRLSTAVEFSEIARADLLAWAHLMALDGLLYYLTVDDSRIDTMHNVLAWLHKELDVWR